ncbi:uncharacterized protein LOC128715069 [Anopheles marshallii]|uniref:uncharacterized protein LOC128715069 n=1 Tax=Anopheles marshallii TaxID=1521116 RepID=UPI00237A44B4|nr:uncharacterized protein LOC128715069 [Anopheles marshallii]
MSTEAVGRSDHETSVATVPEKGSICKDENENTELCFGEASLNGGFSESYMKTLTTLSLNTTMRGPKHYCYECDYYLHTQLSMTTHMKMHRKPFCPICFRMFLDEAEVHVHIAELHSNLFPNAVAWPVFEDDSFSQTEAPPNSPTQEYKTRSTQDDRLGMINNNTISLWKEKIVEKLRQHQQILNFGVQSKGRQLKSSRSHSEPSMETNSRKPRKTRNYRGESERLLSIAGVTGKVHKGSKPKPIAPRTPDVKSNGDTANTSLKMLTSRFGRVISLKVPQF